MKSFIILTALVLFISGCKEEPKPENKPVVKKELQETKNVAQKKINYIYRGDFKIEFKGERIVWFKPYLTEAGDVISEKTVTLLPSQPKWSLKDKPVEKVYLSEEISKFLKED